MFIFHVFKKLHQFNKKSAVTFLTLAKNKLELLHVKEYKEITSKQI